MLRLEMKQNKFVLCFHLPRKQVLDVRTFYQQKCLTNIKENYTTRERDIATSENPIIAVFIQTFVKICISLYLAFPIVS